MSSWLQRKPLRGGYGLLQAESLSLWRFMRRRKTWVSIFIDHVTRDTRLHILSFKVYRRSTFQFRYTCSCPEGRYGRHCERSTFGFEELSYMTFPALDSNTNDITIVFATTKPDALLLYNYAPQAGGRSDFVVLELVDGRVVFSYGGARSAITSVTIKTENSVSDGEWRKVTATRNGRVVSLSVSMCREHGDICDDCRPGDGTCYADDVGPTGLASLFVLSYSFL